MIHKKTSQAGINAMEGTVTTAGNVFGHQLTNDANLYWVNIIKVMRHAIKEIKEENRKVKV